MRNLIKDKNPWSYINSKSKTCGRVNEIHSDPSDPYSPLCKDDEAIAKVSSDHFASVFTEKDDSQTLTLCGTFPTGMSPAPLMEKLQVAKQDLKKLLKDLPNKSPGPDQLHLKVLKYLAKHLVTPLTILYR